MNNLNISKFLIQIGSLILITVQLTTAQEQILAFDHRGTVLRFTPVYDSKILGVSVPGTFLQAELLVDKDSLVTLEVQYTIDSVIYRKAIIVSGLELEALRNRVDSLVYVPETNDSQGARGTLLTGSLLSGLCIYGFSLPVVLDITSDRGQVGLYMLGAGGSFFIPYVFTKNKTITYGQANLTFYGLTRGFLHGVLLNNFLGDHTRTKPFITAGLVTGMAEGVAWFHFVNKRKLSDGTANLMKVYGDFGFLAGGAIANQFHMPFEDTKSTWGVVLAGSVAGLTIGYYLGKRYPVKTGDGDIINTAGLLGAFLPLSVITAVTPNHSQTYTTTSLLTGLAGCYVGHLLVKNRNFSFAQGYITKLGTIAGGLVGLGATYLLVENAKKWQYLAGSYLGAQTSFYLLYKMNKRPADVLGNRLKFYCMPANYFLANRASIQDPSYYSRFPLFQCALKLN